MSFNNLSVDKKREILNISTKNNEQVIYESAVRLGIDPSSFDLNSFSADLININSGSEKFLDNLLKAIESLKFINSELNSLES
jgi:hypothetical protein